jgi:hypothetical protein
MALVPPRPIFVSALVALAIPTLACRERGAPAPANREPATAPAPVEAAPASPPADPEPAAPEPQRIGADGGVEVRFGLALAGNGDVVDPVLSFAAGDPVCVSVQRLGAPASSLDLAWFDDDGNELGRASAEFAGTPPRAALCLPGAPSLARRTYRLDLTLDGAETDSAQFTIGDLRQSASPGGA